MAFLWTTLHVNNLEESINFYEKFVGIKVNRRFESRPGVEIAFLGDGQTKLELVANGGQYLESDQISIGFSVKSLDEKLEEIKQSGIPIYREPIQPNPNIKFFYVKDPNGISVQFAEQIDLTNN